MQIRTPFPIQDRELAHRLSRPQFPRSSRYDPMWIADYQMGPHVLWLAESLLQVAQIEPGSRVMDLGCGKAVSSIFLAEETGAQIWATDLWIKPTENFRRIEAAGLAERVFPIHAEARALPYADEFFDAVVSFDAYQYFGTDDMYLSRLLPVLKHGGLVGIVVPGVTHELDEVPEHLKGWFPPGSGWHSPEWWRRLWSLTELVAVEHHDLVPDGWRLWLDWSLFLQDVDAEQPFPGAREAGLREARALEADRGQTLGFTRIVARKR